MPRKLHIGGKEKKPDWEILNAVPDPSVDHLGDIRDLSQFGDETFEAVYASHVLEHVQHRAVLPTLQGIKRVLIPGGQLYLSVPDLDILCHFLSSPYASPDQKYQTMTMIYGGQVDEYDFHYTGFNGVFMQHFLNQAGFSSIQRVDTFGIFNDTSDYSPFGFRISLNVIATK